MGVGTLRAESQAGTQRHYTPDRVQDVGISTSPPSGSRAGLGRGLRIRNCVLCVAAGSPVWGPDSGLF